MQAKCVQMVSRKMHLTEMLLDMVPIVFYTGSDIKYQDWLAISNENFYFIYNNNIKKQIPISSIQMVTVSAFSHQIVLHCNQEDIRMSSYQNAKIFKNILKARQKVLRKDQLFPVLIEKEKSLLKFVWQEQKKRGFFSSLFHRSGGTHKKNRDSSSSLENRQSYCKLEVSDKTFLHQISQNIYSCNYSNVQLLFISGGYSFFFDEFDFIKEEIDSKTHLFRHREIKENFILRKIVKSDQQTNKTIRQYLKEFKLNSNKEQVLYAIESDKYFETISPFSLDQKTLETLISQEQALSQIDLMSIFYKLVGLIEGGQWIFHSLHPKYIIINDNFLVSEVQCINQGQLNINYLSPQELDPQSTTKADPEIINLWKIGILLYEAAFFIQPFPIQYLAEVLIHNKTFELSFPSSNRSFEFKNFLGQLLQVDSSKRGGGSNWKTSIFDHKWVKQTML